MRIFPVVVMLLCTGCVVAPPPPPYTLAAIPQSEPSQQACREFDTPVTINGQQQKAHGTACLQPDGSWKVEQNLPNEASQTYILAPPDYQQYYPPAYVADPWFYGPPLFFSGVFIGGGWGYHHAHGGWHGAWHGGFHH